MKTLKDYEYFRTKNGVLYHGECLDVVPLIDDDINLIYTDPPYKFEHLGGEGIKRAKKKFNELLKNDLCEFDINKYYKLLFSKFNNLFIWTNKQAIYEYFNKFIPAGYKYDILVWNKTNGPPYKSNTFLSDTEYCLYFKKDKVFFDSKLDYIKYKKYYISNNNGNNIFHPTQKPLLYCKNHIEITSDKDHLILDPFAGGGTTAEACELLNRKWICIDKEENNCKNIVKRLKSIQLEL
jgi:site-specific DNA-methyltransferase (adenine-specific)